MNQTDTVEKSKFNLVFWATLFTLALLAYANRFVLDDAFITFDYARNLAEGKGLTWNGGERLEGYTNFLWALLMSVPISFELDPVKASYVISIFCFLLSLTFTYKLCLILLRSHWLSLATIALLGTNFSFSSYATSGLETQLQACLFTATFLVFLSGVEHRAWNTLPLIAISLLLVAAIMTRPDSGLMAALILPSTTIMIYRQQTSLTQKAVKVTCLLAPLACLLATWLLWKLSYYGDILPNTFYVRTFSLQSAKQGVIYIYCFLTSYLLTPFLILFIIALPKTMANKNSSVLLIALMVSLWLLYIVSAGGDFMEFRFFVPIMPLIFVLIGWSSFNFTNQNEIRCLFAALVMLGSLHHHMTFHEHGKRIRIGGNTIETIQELEHHIIGKSEEWKKIGQILGKAFDYSPDVTIAITAAGAIPYYSRLTTVDMLGPNDKWVARNAPTVSHYMTAHQKCAPLSYLMSRDVHILIGHPWMLWRDEQHVYTSDIVSQRLIDICFMASMQEEKLPETTRVIEIPVNDKYSVSVLYLKKTSIVDHAISKNGWKVLEIRRGQANHNGGNNGMNPGSNQGSSHDLEKSRPQPKRNPYEQKPSLL